MKYLTNVLSFLTLIALLAAPLVRADEPPPPPPPGGEAGPGPRMEEMRERRLKQLEEKLGLTPEQITQIEAIWDKAAEQARAASDADRREARKARRDAMKQTHDAVRAVLTPEQQKIFDTLKPEGPRGPKPPKED